jgi:integrase
MLAWWADELAGRDLRRISLVGNIKPALVGATQRQHRIAVLKSLYAWLRKERNLLSVAEDPTFQTLPTPQARPQQWTREKVIPVEDYRKVRELVAPHWRDGMDVQAATGWHVTELIRFAMAGSIAPAPDDEQEGTAGILVCPQTKAGEPLRTRVGPELLGAARRLLERGMFTRRHYGIAINKACKDAGVARFTPGRFRHTVATYAINRGADPASVAAFLNHKSARTTRRFYATHAAARRVPTLSAVSATM